MAKTSASVVLAVLVVALFLNGYNAAESVETDNQSKKAAVDGCYRNGTEACSLVRCYAFCKKIGYSFGICPAPPPYECCCG
ncbi:defensin-like protein 45 [Vicia villosa]|uniref:defensin-like protein 45 n=1 Tax=Vicia villosa TaxID=3911 RepID=UPI00273BA498|nr:defensin-like protein 45 [Vicia villosa]